MRKGFLVLVFLFLVLIGTGAEAATTSGVVREGETKLGDFFPKTENGANGILFQYRTSDGKYTNLTNLGDYHFGTLNTFVNIPYWRLTNQTTGEILVHPAALSGMGAERDSIMRVTLNGDYGKVKVTGEAFKTNGNMRFLIYKGENNFSKPIWQVWDEGKFNLDITYKDGEQLFFAVDAGPDDYYDWAYFKNIRFQAEAIDSLPPTTTASLTGSKGNNDWYTSNVQIALTATDNPGGTGVAKTEYSFDCINWIIIPLQLK